jgi:hypothetical protein
MSRSPASVPSARQFRCGGDRPPTARIPDSLPRFQDRAPNRTDVIGLGTHSTLEVSLNCEVQEGRRHWFAQDGGPHEGLTDRQPSGDVQTGLWRILENPAP